MNTIKVKTLKPYPPPTATGPSNGHRPTTAVSNGHSPVRFTPYRARTRPKLPFNLAGLKEAIRQSLLGGSTEMELYETLTSWNKTRPSGKRWSKKKCEILIGLIAFETFFKKLLNDKKHAYELDEYHQPPLSTWGKSDAEVGNYFMVNNGLVDWHLPIPATVWRVWASLLRHANNQPGRLVKKVSHEQLSGECNMQLSTVGRALRYLDAIRAIKTLFKGGSPRQGARLTSVYLVPSLKDVNIGTLLVAIRATPWRIVAEKIT